MMADRTLKLERHRTSSSISDRYRIQVLDRAVRILDCFGFDHQELSVSEIGDQDRPAQKHGASNFDGS